MRRLLPALSSLALWLAAPAHGQSVALAGVLGHKALLVIDGGAPRALAPNDSVQGVLLLQVATDHVVVSIAGQRQTIGLGASPVSVGARGAGAAGGQGRRVVLKSDSRGHFLGDGQINGKTMRYMVDTGASIITLGRADAERMGLPFLQGTPALMRTANGDARGWRLRLASVRVGDVTVHDMEAVVIPTSMPFVLLGNNFLSYFQMTRSNDSMVLEKR